MTSLCLASIMGGMALVTDSKRTLISREIISALDPIPGADAIEVASVRGWKVVVKVGEFAPGDHVVYFEPDTALPVRDPRFRFLAARGVKDVDGVEYHILKTARLRGCWSEGLVLPASMFPDFDDLDRLKWEPPLPTGGGQIVGVFDTSVALPTDAERVQNISVLGIDESWSATEKIDGCSVTISRDTLGAVRVFSRNWEVADGANQFWAALGLLGGPECVPLNGAVQMELAGPGIQGNPLGLYEKRVFVFRVWIDGSVIGRSDWTDALLSRSAPVIDIPIPATADDALDLVENMVSTVNPNRKAEGVVWQSPGGFCVKALSRKYLLKHGS